MVRNKDVYLTLGILPDGSKDVLGLWILNTEGAKAWTKVFNDMKTRGCNNILIAVTDGLKGMPEALGAVFPAATLQTCIAVRRRAHCRPPRPDSEPKCRQRVFRVCRLCRRHFERPTGCCGSGPAGHTGIDPTFAAVA